jgi:hypothetical protein
MAMKHLVMALALVMSATGCTRFEIRSEGLPQDAVYFSELPGASDHFEVGDTASFLFWGLVPLFSPSPADKLLPYLGDGKRIANFSITTRYEVSDFLVSVLTLGIYGSRTVTYEGDLVSR